MQHFNAQDESYMQVALDLAAHAEQIGEVPVGAVLVANDGIIGKGWNAPISLNDPTAHAEIMALRDAANSIKNYRLINTALYVTIEPCVMCAGALVHARVQRVVFGAFDAKAGAVGSVINIFELAQMNHKINYQQGLLADQCSLLLKNFFKARR